MILLHFENYVKKRSRMYDNKNDKYQKANPLSEAIYVNSRVVFAKPSAIFCLQGKYVDSQQKIGKIAT